MKIDEDFVKGVSYYIGDGRMTAPRSLSTVNQDIETIKFFIKWLQKYFKFDLQNIKIKILIAQPSFNGSILKKRFSKKLGIKYKEIHSIKQKYKSKPHHSNLVEIWANNVSARRNFDKSIPLVKKRCLKNKKLAIAYVKGIMAAEGSPKYHKKSGSRNVHLKMKDKKEIIYIGNLLNDVIGIKSSILKVKSEEGMWLITISGIEEIKKLNELNIFEIESRKRNRLREISKSYKRAQVKKGYVEDYYITKLKFYNKKLKKRLTAPELGKLIKRDRTRTINVLRLLEKNGLVKGKRKTSRGRPFEFWT